MSTSETESSVLTHTRDKSRISSTAVALAVLYARLALGAAFLSAVADRFGWWGARGGWGNFANFTAYTAQVNSFMPAATIPYLAWAATIAEIALGLALVASGLLGIVSARRAEWMRWVAWGSAVLLALFGTAMAISLGIKRPLDYSVFSASACALLLAVYPDRINKAGFA
jgi:uncharacterized membrane protein YphA (DoxX/SURF4 family)